MEPVTTYQYDCATCGNAWDVIKSHRKMEEPEQCSRCQTLGSRRFLPARVFFTKTAVTHAEYNPGLGKVIQNQAHLKDVLAEHHDKTGKQIVEVGNDYGSGQKMTSTFNTERTRRKEEEWNNLKVDLP